MLFVQSVWRSTLLVEDFKTAPMARVLWSSMRDPPRRFLLPAMSAASGQGQSGSHHTVQETPGVPGVAHRQEDNPGIPSQVVLTNYVGSIIYYLDNGTSQI